MTKTSVVRALCAAAGLALAASGANAVMITTIYTGFAGGTLGGNAFGVAAPVPFTITGIADTANVVSFGNGWRVVHDSATIEIGGLGSFAISTATSSAVNNNSNVVVFGNNAEDLALQILGPDVAFDTWDMLSSIGPIDLASNVLQWNSGPLATDGGELILNSGTGDGTFQAIVVPAPAGLGAFALGGMVAARRRR